MRHVQRQAAWWLAVTVLMIVMVFFVVIAPARATPLRTVDILLLFGGGFAAGAALVRGLMAWQQSR